MGLEKYNEKRDFSKTKEPKGTKKSSTDALRFVVQKHAASRLHYDFRLEIDGVLVSWAVPKGPSANPADRRLAVQTEDHPMAYIDFEGTIPKGEYGGGTVMVWDNGTFHAEGSDDIKKDKAIFKKQLQEGSIKVVLNGKKLKGSWNLVRMKTEESQWLLMKGKDEFADKNMEFDQNSVLSGKDLKAIEKSDNVWHSKEVSEEEEKKKKTKKKPETVAKEEQQPASFLTTEALKEAVPLPEFPLHWKPQLATLADAPFDNKDWIFETKFDGYRCLAQINKGEVTLVSRNQKPFNGKYPLIAQELQAITQDVILDGEVVVEDPKGKTHFQWLQHYEDNPELGKLRFYVFDMLYFQGFDLRQLSLINRKKILEALLPKNDTIIYSAHVKADGIAAFNKSRDNEGEGLIAKKADSRYHTGQRTKEWLKIKTEKQQEMVIGGFTNPQGTRKGLGALLCGYYEGKDFKYAGKVGTGFTESVLEDLREKLDQLVRKTSPFVNPPKMAGVHWVKPELIAQIKFSEFTEAKSMRHPVFLGLREDKNPTDIVIEKPSVHTGAVDESEGSVPPAAAKKQKAKRTPLKTEIEFTNTDKIFWPKQKITKGHVIAYYDTVAEYILPYLKDRPQSLRRNPDGIKNIGFFQKDVAGVVPKWIKTHKIKSESTGEQIEYLLCQDKETLLFLANWGCIELNPWSSRIGKLDKPDYIIFDVDAKEAPLKDIITTALQVKEVLDSIQVPAYIKTSGGNGLHIFIPVLPKYTYDQTRNFSHIVSQMVANQLPEIVSLERTPSKRKGKVYLDFLQNGKGKTMASIYSLRPRESATISTPLDWSEVDLSLDIKRFTIKEVIKRLEEKGDLWKDFFNESINLKEILQKI